MTAPTDEPSAYDRFTEKLAEYANPAAAKEWLSRNLDRVRALFENVTLRDFVFEPIKGVFEVRGKDADSEIRAAITAVAVANAVMAGLPGKMGIGVVVSMGVEAWMAWVIAQRVGIVLRDPSDIWKYFGLLAGVLGTIFWGFRQLLGLAFSAFSAVIPGINPMIFAELFVTNLVGVLFWVGFKEAAATGSFEIPLRAWNGILAETKALYGFQAGIITKGLSPSNLRTVWQRLTAWLSGDILSDKPQLRGELFATAAMAWLLAREFDRLDGPLGREFIGAIRDRYPDLAQASLGEIADHMAQYDADQLAGVVNMIKGKLFERLVALHENTDADEWRAVLHATSSPAYIEHSLLRYPDIPIMTTEEVAAHFEGNPQVMGTSIGNVDLTNLTEDNFDQLLDAVAPPGIAEAAATGVAAKAVAILWPFTMAYLRGRITDEQLGKAFERVLGESGVALAARVSYAVILGPVFAWCLLARGVMALTQAAAAGAERGEGPVRRLVWTGRPALSAS